MKPISRTILCAAIALCLLVGFTGISYSDGASATRTDAQPLTIMQPDRPTLMKWIDDYNKAPAAQIDGELDTMLSAAAGARVATSMSLLDRLDYIPGERNQGYCGDCWVWAGTGILEIADSVQRGVKDRHSIQFLNSCMTVYNGNPFYACQGGNMSKFASFYNDQLYSIPWSNTNAAFGDGSQACGYASSSCVSCAAISKSPGYTYNTVQAQTILTQGKPQATAIKNIKNVLNQNKAVQFAFWLPTQGNWDAFRSFWRDDAESVLWPTDTYCGESWTSDGGGHAVLLVGYNDDDVDTSKHYWIILNSWGDTTGRPTGLFRMPMYMNYSCTYQDDGYGYYSRQFMTLDVGAAVKRLTLTKAGKGTGTVTSDPAGITCGGTCSAAFEEGDTVTLTAQPADAYSSFSRWSGCATVNGDTCTVAMTADRKVTATFIPTPTYQLTVTEGHTNAGKGTITSDDTPMTINCPTDCRQKYLKNTVVTLTAVADSGSVFKGWKPSIAPCDSTGPCVVTMDKAKSVQGVFVGDYALKVINKSQKVHNVGGAGTVTYSTSINCATGSTTGCSAKVPYHTSVTLTANPDAGSKLKGWTACPSPSPTENTCSLTMDRPVTVTATFEPDGT